MVPIRTSPVADQEVPFTVRDHAVRLSIVGSRSVATPP
jgi:hypothetical protein